MTEQLIVRLDPGLKAQAARLAAAEGKNLSSVVRELIGRYIQERDMSLYVNGLLDRMGGALAEEGIGPGDVERVIREYRDSKK